MIAAALMATTLAGAGLSDLPEASRNDLTCLAALAVMVERPGISETDQQQLGGGMMYYLGRLEGRDPGANWIRRMLTYTEATPLTEVEAHSERCGQELIAKGQEIFAVLDL